MHLKLLALSHKPEPLAKGLFSLIPFGLALLASNL